MPTPPTPITGLLHAGLTHKATALGIHAPLASIEKMEALEVLTSKLCEKFISGFGVNDGWSLYLGGYWLIAQNVISEDEGLLNQWLYEHYTPFRNTVDKEYISKCAMVASLMRKEVTGLKLDEAYNLTIEFEKESKLIIPSNVEIVDWQWCLNESGNSPYQDYLVACFWKGKIEINTE